MSIKCVLLIKVLSGMMGLQVWHLVTGCHPCFGSTPK